MAKRKSGTFVIPSDLLEKSEVFKGATIEFRYPTTLERLNIGESLNKDTDSTFALFITSVLLNSVSGSTLEDESLSYGKPHMGYSMLDGGLVDELIEEGVLNKIYVNVFTEIYTSAEEKKSQQF